MMISVLLLQRLRKSSWTEGRETPMTLPAPLTILCGAFCLTYCSWSTMSRYNTLERSPPHHCRKFRGCWWGEACISFLRKYSLCWARFMKPEMFLLQLRSHELCTPRNLMFSTLSTVQPLMLRGACSGCDLQKSKTISFFLSALSTRLFSLHQPSRCLTSFLYIDSSFLSMSPATMVSSTNLKIRVPSCLDAQSCVSSVNNNALSAQPWGAPVLSMMELEVSAGLEGLALSLAWIPALFLLFVYVRGASVFFSYGWLAWMKV